MSHNHNARIIPKLLAYQNISRTKLKSVDIFISLMFIVYSLGNLYGQNPKLKVGDRAPSTTAFKWIKGEPVEEFKRDQIYVVEFGATWCAPCKKVIPELTALQKKYQDEVIVIGYFVMELNNEPLVTENPKYVQKVEKYVSRLGSQMEYHVAVDVPEKTMEKDWIRAAGFNGIPRTFLVDREGYIAWTGNNMETVDQLITTMINGEYRLEEMKGLAGEKQASRNAQEKAREAFLYGHGREQSQYLFRSVLSKYSGDTQDRNTPWYIWGYANADEDFDVQKYHGIIAMGLGHIYNLAYGDTVDFRPWYDNKNKQLTPTSYGRYWKTPIIEVSDNSVFNDNFNDPNEKWNYSLKVPKEKATAKFLQEAMRRDLKTYFGYEVIIEIRRMPYWRFTTSPEAKKKLKTKTPGADLSISTNESSGYSTITNINMPYLVHQMWITHQLEVPFVDETGIEGDIDLEFKGNAKDMDEAIESFKENGIILEKAEKDFKVVVIRDPKS